MLLAALLLSGCAQQMAEHAGYKPLTKSEFYTDGRSSREPVAGTVARGQMRLDSALYEGRDDKGDYVDTFPFEMTEAVLKRGRERYEIFCSVCHGLTGHGDGRIVKRGFTVPPNYITEESRGYRVYDAEKKRIPKKLTDVPVGYIYEVISKGYGAMADHASQVPVRDRWAITGYIRALQASQLPEFREKLDKGGAK